MKFQVFNRFQLPFHQHFINKRPILWGVMASAVLSHIIPSHAGVPAIAQPSSPNHPAPDALSHNNTEPLQMPSLDIEAVSVAPINVLNAGAEPRQVLQFTPAVDSQQELVMTMDLGGTMQTSGITQTLPDMPTTQVVMETTVTRIDQAGNRYVEFEYTDVTVVDSTSVPTEVLDAMRGQLQQMEGLSGSWVVNEQGYLSQFEMRPPETMADAMAENLQQVTDSIQQMSVPFPTEAVGMGAQWQMPYNVAMNGVDMSGVATYELVNIEGDRLTLNTAITQQGTASNLSGLGLPENMNMSVQQLDSSGQGIIDINLKQVMPIYGDISMTSDSRFNIEHQGLEVPMSMNMLMNMSLVSE